MYQCHLDILTNLRNCFILKSKYIGQIKFKIKKE